MNHIGSDCLESVLVILPTFNEAGTIDRCIDGLISVGEAMSILVVDDRSPDGTAQRVRARPEYRQRVFLLERTGRRGLGSAYREAFCWAQSRGFDICVGMDADLSHDPSAVPRMLDAVRGGADIAIGSRYLGGDESSTGLEGGAFSVLLPATTPG